MELIVGLIIGLAVGIIVLLILGLIVQWLWNTTLPDIFGIKTITTIQAIKLVFLAAILFGGHRAVIVEEPAPDALPAQEQGAES